LFLFDEPFSNLDAKLRATARIELKRLLHEFPVTSVYVTHDQIEAVALAHRIAVMRAGKIEQVGDYRTLYENPINLFVASFVGTPTINLFEGHVHDHHWQGVNFGGFPIRTDLTEGSRVTLGVRPEGIALAEDGLVAQVDSLTPYFAERFWLVEVQAGSEHWHLLVPMTTKLQVTETIRCQLKPDALLFFDTETGLRIG
jgi:multiple sugar transport system ATP-binding protein